MDIDKTTQLEVSQECLDKSAMEVKAKEIFDLKKQKEAIDKQVDDLKVTSAAIDKQITMIETSLLKDMKAFGDIKEFEVDNIVSTIFQRENIGYTSETDVLNYLKEKYDSQYIKTKVSEALDKNALKKAIKTDAELAAALEAMTIKSVTEYVIVTSAENHQKMLEHINKSNN